MASCFHFSCFPAFSPSSLPHLLLPLVLLLRLPVLVRADCWLIEGDKGYVWLAICSQNQPPYEAIPQHINNTVHDLRLNENKLKAVFFTSLSRFTNLTDLNLTKNEIAYIEDGAFLGQANLQVLQLGYNKLTNLTEGMLRGLGRMQCLFVHHNIIEVISYNAFWECPSLSSLDLSSNKLACLDPATFTGLGRLMVCELAGNPFHCGCKLYNFLTWLEAFNNITHTYDRLQCESPRELFGLPLLSPVPGHGRNAHSILASICRDGMIIPGITSLPPDFDSSGLGPDISDRVGIYHQPTASTTDLAYTPSIKLQHVSLSSASLLVQIPRPYSKMYILVQYNNGLMSDVINLKNNKEIVTMNNLNAHTNYTFCVASIRNSQRYNHTCLYFATQTQSSDDIQPNSSTTKHYIMTILGCLFGMLIILGLVYYCLRKRRIQEKQKSVSVKKTILEMRYGTEAVTAAANDPSVVQKLNDQAHHQHHHSKLPSFSSFSSGMLQGSANTSSSRISSIPQVEKMATAFSEAMAANKGNYMDMRTSVSGEQRVRDGRVVGCRENNRTDGDEDSDHDDQGSVSEISSIAKEVDKVNQIINNCIDVLKVDSAAAVTTVGTTPPPLPAGITSTARGLIPLSSGIKDTCQNFASPKIPPPPPLPRVLPLSEQPRISGGGFLSPPYLDPPAVIATQLLQRQHSADASTVMLGTVKNHCSQIYSPDVPMPCSPEKGYPLVYGEPLEMFPLVGGQGGDSSCVGEYGCVVNAGGGFASHGGQHHQEVHPDYHCSKHRHSFPVLYYQGASHSPAEKASFLKPLSRAKKEAAYSQLSPRNHNYSGYSSSPEYSSEISLRIWERFRPYKKSPREEASYLAAGHALCRKVQFAKDEDLHNILDYWKGVSAQQKL